MPRGPKKHLKKTSESCDATLTINGFPHAGTTGKGHGHAEMDALHKYYRIQLTKFRAKNSDMRDSDAVPEIARKLHGAKTKVVLCASRPVCSQCGMVLRHLGFKTGTATVWGTKTMGKTEWNVSPDVRLLLKASGLDINTVLALRR